jgi:hypothetical protein
MNSDVELLKNNSSDEKLDRINEILDTKISKMTITEIMNNQLFIMNFIKQNILNSKIILYLEWVIKSIIKICNDTNTTLFTHKTKHKLITRSSYHFCSKKNECNDENCTDHHFVFHLLYADISSLYDYLKNNKKYDLKEVFKSINTIIFVINHMMYELLNRH